MAKQTKKLAAGNFNLLFILLTALLVHETPGIAEELNATIISTQVICKQPGKYIGWPTITRTGDGDLLIVFSGDRESHTSHDGKTQMVRSRDGGKTWSNPITIHDTPLDDRDAGIIRTNKGTMLVSWFTNKGGGEWQGQWTIRSTDNGYTWEKAVRTEATAPHGSIQLSDGGLLYLGQSPHCFQWEEGEKYYCANPGNCPYKIVVEQSLDDGQSWKVISTFPVPEDGNMLSYDEPHMVEADNGKLVALFRDYCGQLSGHYYMRQSESTDGGYTWSAPHITPVQGYPPHVIRLQNGWLLVVYGKRWEPFGEYACISRDQGKTWDVEYEIKLSSAPNGDLGYPASVQLDDGSIWTVYYQVDESGEKPCLMGTHWRLD